MTPTEATNILRQFNAWRRDFDDKVEQPDTREISEAIDAAVEMIERMDGALHHISLCSQNSASSKGECGRIARAALEEST